MLLAGLHKAEAQTVVTAGSAIGSSQTYGCFQCIVEQGTYCSTDTTYARHSTIDDTTAAKCQTSTTCASGTAVSYSASNNMELTLAACPTTEAVCGSTVMSTYADATTAATTVTPPADLA